MTKLSGDCTMVIEPFSFKITLFSVRSPSNTQNQSPAGRPPSQQPGSSASQPPATPGGTSVMPYSPSIHPASSSQTPAAASPSPAPLGIQPATNGAQTPVASAADGQLARHPEHRQPPNPPPRGAPVPNTDPVIQMLAARAATDAELKSLMKIVAQGQANQAQLAVFQRHIDELNNIIQTQKKQSTARPPGYHDQGPSPTSEMPLPTAPGPPPQ